MKNKDRSTEEDTCKITCVKTEQRIHNVTLTHGDDDTDCDIDEQFNSIPRTT